MSEFAGFLVAAEPSTAVTPGIGYAMLLPSTSIELYWPSRWRPWNPSAGAPRRWRSSRPHVAFVEPRGIAAGAKWNQPKKKHISINKKGMNSVPFSQIWVFFVYFSWLKNLELHHSPSPPATGEQHQTSSVHTLLTQRSIGKIHQKSSQKEYLDVNFQLWKISTCSTVAMKILPHIRILGDRPQSTP